MAAPMRRLVNPALFVCDIQEKFKPAIYEYSKVIATTQKMLKAASILNIPVFVTTQNKARLGETDPDLKIDSPQGISSAAHVDKSLFSMWTPEIQSAVSTTLNNQNTNSPDDAPRRPTLSAVIVGIESHICVTQTSLDLLGAGHKVYVLADGVSSCNQEEIPVALARLRAEGVVVTTSESFLYECMGDASIREFKEVVGLVKETKEGTKESLKALASRI